MSTFQEVRKTDGNAFWFKLLTGKVFTSQTVVDFSRLCRAACCLHAEAPTSKLPELELWGFHRMAKTTVDLSFLEENSSKRSLEWMGWGDNETDGRFYKRPKSANRSQAKAETTAEARREEENMGLFQIIKKKIKQLKK